MRKPLFLIVFLALAACASGEDAPDLTGSWNGSVGGQPLALTLTEDESRLTGIALWGQDQYTVEGTHDHPEVALSLTGPFTATTVVSVNGSLSDAETLEATLSTPGFPDQPTTFRRGAAPAP